MGVTEIVEHITVWSGQRYNRIEQTLPIKGHCNNAFPTDTTHCQVALQIWELGSGVRWHESELG